jgi:hypothetical protein
VRCKPEREWLILFQPTGSPVLIVPGNRLVGFGPTLGVSSLPITYDYRKCNLEHQL